MSISHTPDSPDAPPPESKPSTGKRLRAALAAAFGSYQPPRWPGAVAGAVTRHGKAHRRKLALGVAVVSVVSVAGLVVHQWWASRPRPDTTRASITSPDAPREPKAEEAIGAPSPLRVHFDESAAPLEAVGKPVTAGIAMVPQVEGAWSWSSDSELTFKPAKQWPVGMTGAVRLLPGLLAPHITLDNDELEYTTPPFSFRMESARFDEDVRDPKLHRVVVTMVASHPFDDATLRNNVDAKLALENGVDKVAYELELADSGFRAYLRTANIPIPRREGNITITVGGRMMSSWGGEPLGQEVRTDVVVPGQGTFFRVEQTHVAFVQNERHEPERVLFVRLTSGVDAAALEKNLELVLLPKDRPPQPGIASRRSHHWSSTEEVTTAVLAAGNKLALVRVPVESPEGDLYAFQIDAPDDRVMWLRLKAGTPSRGGYVLADDFAAIHPLGAAPRTVEIMSRGALMTLSGERKLPLLSRGIEVIEARVARFLPGTLHHLLSQTRGRFEDPRFLSGRFNEVNLATILHEEVPAAGPGDMKTAYSSLDLSPLLDGARRGLFLVEVRERPPKHSDASAPQGFDVGEVGGDVYGGCEGCDEEGYEDGTQGDGDDGDWYDDGYRDVHGRRADRRLLLLTDLGVLQKRAADGSFDVFVQQLHSGTPVGGAHVTVLALNGTSVMDRFTDATGRASFPKLTDLPPEKQPLAVVVEKDDDVSFLPWNRRDRVVSTSRFDVGGARTLSARGLEGTVFSDRGLYRPGERIHIAGIVKNGGWSMPVAGVPLELVFTNPAGADVDRARVTLKANGFFEAAFSTSELSPTGSYQATLYTVKDNRRHAQLAETAVRVEEFEPDRMKIRAVLSDARVDGWISPQQLRAEVHMENLFGTPAEGREVEGTIDLYPASPHFARYPDHAFADPSPDRRHTSESLGATRTNEAGDASFDLGLERFAAGTYRLTFTAEGHDVGGGRAVIARAGAFVSPLQSLVGWKADGPLGSIPVGLARKVELIAIDPKLDMVERAGLSTELVEQKYLSTLIRRPDGTYAYESRLTEIPRSTAPLSIGKKGSALPLDTKAPGDFVLGIKDQDGTVITRIHYSVSGVAALTGNLEKNAELDVRLDRVDYKVGDPIRVRVVGPYVGAGLITIERERVFAHKWFRSTSPSFEETIEVPPGLEGNAYVHISYLRDPAAPEVFTSPLSTGIVPFSISRAERTVGVTLTAPTRVQPGDAFKVRVAADQPTDVVVFGVDEGILQLARYQAPDPLGYFMRKRALQVETSEILDLLMPEYSVYRRALAPGGDGGDAALGKNLNPFKRKTDKPAVFWSGIVAVDPKGRDVDVTVPETFDGNLKIMAVAVSDTAIGTAQAATLVRGHFVLSPSAPLFLTPGDEAVVTVGITNLVEGSGKGLPVKLDVDTKGGVELASVLGDSVAIDEGREVAVRFQVRAKPALGAASVVLRASGKGKTSKRSIELSVRPASPYQVAIQSGFVKGGAERVPLKRTMFDSYRKLNATVSLLPLGMGVGLDTYLNSYPYGCTEQMLSRAAPVIVAKGQPELKKNISTSDSAWASAMAVVAARQQESGAIGLWSDLGEAPPFVTLYALHVMLDGKERGLAPPSGVMTRMVRFIEDKLQPEAREPLSAREQAYALYLLARHGRARGPDMERLKKQLDDSQDAAWRRDLTGIYLAAAWKVSKDDDKARELLGGTKLFDAVQPDWDNFYNQSVRDAQLLYLLSKHFPEALRYVNPDQLSALVRQLAGRDLSALTAAYALMALDAYASAAEAQPGTALSVAEVMGDPDKGGSATTLKLDGGLVKTGSFSDDASALEIAASGAVAGFYSVIEAGFDRTPPTERQADGVEIIRELRNSAGPVTQVGLGDVVDVVLKLRSLKYGGARVAVVDLLPAGFSIEMEHAADAGRRDHARVGGGLAVDSTDVREDRIVIYARPTAKVEEYVYRVRAISPGSFSMPPSFVQGMYDPTLVGRSTASTVVVK